MGDGDGDGGAPGGLGGGGSLNESQLPLHFSSVAMIAELSGESKDENPTLSADTLAICFTSDRDGGSGGIDVWCSQKPRRDEPFEAPRALDELNTDRFESSSAISLDGLGIWFGSEREGGKGGLDIWFSERTSVTDPFGPPRPVEELNTEFDEIPRPPGGPVPTMPLASRQGDGPYVTLLSPLGTDGFFGSTSSTGLASAEGQSLVDAQLSQDGLLLVFTLSPDGDDPGNLYAAERASLREPFANPTALVGVNSEGDDRDPWLSPDGGTLYFASDKNGDFDLFVAHRHPAAED